MLSTHLLKPTGVAWGHGWTEAEQVMISASKEDPATGLQSASHPEQGTMQVILEAGWDEWENALIQMRALQLRALQTLLKFHESVSIIFSSHVFIRP